MSFHLSIFVLICLAAHSIKSENLPCGQRICEKNDIPFCGVKLVKRIERKIFTNKCLLLEQNDCGAKWRKCTKNDPSLPHPDTESLESQETSSLEADYSNVE